MKIEQRKTEEVIPYPKNAKEHPEKQIKKIADSIKKFGFNQPIVSESAEIIKNGEKVTW